MYATFFIPKENVKALETRLAKLAKVATKLGVPVITWATVAALAIERTCYEMVTNCYGETEWKPYRALVEHEAITIEGEPPKLSGWVFVATLQHEGGVTLIRSVEEGLPERFRTASPEHCDHCGTKRKRKETFVVRHEETGEYKQVGRSCLKDFLGHKSPEAIAEYFTDLAALLESLGAEPERGESFPIVWSLEEFLAVTSAAIEECGWVSKGMAYESAGRKVATAVYVETHLHAGHNPSLSKSEKEKVMFEVGPTHVARGKEAAAWVEGLEGAEAASDYIHNLKAIVKLGYVAPKMSGYAASIVSSWARAKGEELKKSVLIANGNEYVGEIKKRAEFLLTLLKVFWVETEWGNTAIHKFATPEGNAVTWFASNARVVEDREGSKGTMVEGATYRVMATPKKHETYEGRPQTVVTRAKVLPIAKAPKKKRAKKENKQLTLPAN